MSGLWSGVPCPSCYEPCSALLVAGGLFVVEVMFRTPVSEEAVRRIAAKAPNATLGAGTILSVEQAERAVKAGPCRREWGLRVRA